MSVTNQEGQAIWEILEKMAIAIDELARRLPESNDSSAHKKELRSLTTLVRDTYHYLNR